MQSQTVRRSPFWLRPSAHRTYWERNNCALVYEYDRTADGPEVEIITWARSADFYDQLERTDAE